MINSTQLNVLKGTFTSNSIGKHTTKLSPRVSVRYVTKLEKHRSARALTCTMTISQILKHFCVSLVM